MTKSSRPERRIHPRGELQLVVEYRLESLDEFLKGYSKDVSLGGLFVGTDRPSPVGSTIRITVRSGDGGSLIEGLGRVVRVIEPGPGRSAGMGIQFLHLDEAGRRFIERLVPGASPRPKEA